MSDFELFDPASLAVQLQEALFARFATPIRVEGVLTDWKATPRFGRGKLTAETDTSAHVPIGMQMWRLGAGKSHLTAGLRVTAVGNLQWHPTFGLQLIATQIRPAGLSERHQAVLALRDSVASRGSAQKRIRVRQPGRIAILAPHGGAAALTDARAVLRSLPDHVHLFTHRIPMGGPAAPTQIAKALLSLSRSADLILIVRGGGSTTDLTVWDDPKVVERIAQCPVPIVVGIGHSINASATDLAAHHNAITPTAAAQWVCNLYLNVPPAAKPLAVATPAAAALARPRRPRRPDSTSTTQPSVAHVAHRAQRRWSTMTAAATAITIIALIIGVVLVI